MIFYFHGFSSGAKSHKATVFKKSFTDFDLFVPDYSSHQPIESIRYLDNYIKQNISENQNQKIMLIGSSLGGYYAQYLASVIQEVVALVLINPALEPQKTLLAHVGRQINMVTQKSFDFTQQDYDALHLYDVPSAKVFTPALVLLDEADEIIDYQHAAQVYSAQVDNGSQVISYPGGDHWFQHLEQAIPEIISFYRSTVIS